MRARVSRINTRNGSRHTSERGTETDRMEKLKRRDAGDKKKITSSEGKKKREVMELKTNFLRTPSNIFLQIANNGCKRNCMCIIFTDLCNFIYQIEVIGRGSFFYLVQ
jgi:hypothetical protein